MTLGWVHYQEDSKTNSAVCLPNGGGTRKPYVPNNTKGADMVEAMNNIFFPNSNDKFEELKEMICNPRKIIDKDIFILIRHTHTGLIKRKMRRKNTWKKQSYFMKVGKIRESHIQDDHVVISIQHLCWELNKDCLEEMQN